MALRINNKYYKTIHNFCRDHPKINSDQKRYLDSLRSAIIFDYELAYDFMIYYIFKEFIM